MTNRFYDFIKQYGHWLLMLIAIILYSKSIFYPFQLDDYITIVENFAINDFWSFVKNAKWLKPNSRSLSFSVFSLVASYFGKLPENYRVISILLHAVNGALVFFLVKSMVNQLWNDKHVVLLPHLATAIFLFHPLQSQPVIYITQQMALLAGFFYLASLNLYVLIRQKIENSGKLNFPLLIFLILCFILGLKSKQTVGSLPVLLVVIEIWFFRKSKYGSKFLISILSFLFIGVLAYFLMGFKTYEALGISRLNYLQTEVVVVLHYLWLFLFPKNLSIEHYYAITNQLSNPFFWIGLCLFAGLLSFTIFRRKKQPLIGIGLFILFIGLSIESSVFPIRDAMFEHRMYFPMVGLSVLLTLSLPKFLDASKQLFLLFAISAILSVTTFFKAEHWKTEKKLWQNALNVSPNSPRANSYLGLIYMSENNTVEAQKYFEEALKLDPNHYESLNNLGKIFMDEGQYQLATHYLNKAITINPKNEFAHNNLGVCWESQKAYAQAIRSYGIAIRLNPNFEEAINNQAVAYEKFNQCDKAIFNYLRLERINPNFSNLYFNLANCYLKSGNYLEGEKALMLSLEKDSENVDNLNNLGVVNYYLGKPKNAILFFKKALALSPERKDIADNLDILTKKGGVK